MRYDVGGRANREKELLLELNESGRVPEIDELVASLESTRDTTKLYPCKEKESMCFKLQNVTDYECAIAASFCGLLRICAVVYSQ